MTLALSAPLLAAWEKVGESEIGDVFFDKTTLQRNGTNIRVMTLVSASHKPVNTREAGPLSYVRQVEIICRTMELKLVSGAAYTGKMGTGGVFSREDMGRFAKPDLGSPMARVADLACSAARKGR